MWLVSNHVSFIEDKGADPLVQGTQFISVFRNSRADHLLCNSNSVCASKQLIGLIICSYSLKLIAIGWIGLKFLKSNSNVHTHLGDKPAGTVVLPSPTSLNTGQCFPPTSKGSLPQWKPTLPQSSFSSLENIIFFSKQFWGENYSWIIAVIARTNVLVHCQAGLSGCAVGYVVLSNRVT